MNKENQKWEERLKELCLSGDYPLIHELITNLLKDNKQPIVNQSWEEKFDKKFEDSSYFCSCYEGDMYDRFPGAIKELKSLISQLLIDQKREWVKQEDISYKANSIHERQDFIEEVSEVINSINREGTLIVPQYLKEVIIKLLEKNMDIKEISDDSLLDNFKTLENLRKDDGSFDVKLDEQNYIIGRDEIIRRWIYEQEA